jgi:CheY-like chemotaxis protein
MCRTKLSERTAPLPATELAHSRQEFPTGSKFGISGIYGGAELKNRSESWRVPAMPRIVAYMDDLFFQMKLAETAKHLALEVKVASTAESLLQLLDPPPELVIVDLNARSQPLAAVQQLRNLQPNLRVIGFLSHVQTDLAQQAQAAGFDEVMPRSKFSINLPNILASAVTKNGKNDS